MKLKKIVLWTLLTALLAAAALPGLAADTKSINPMLDPFEVEFVHTQDEFLNILIMGIDLSAGEFHASGNKNNIMDAHTDVNMIIAINKTKGRIDLVSIPRDTLVSVPGVRGIYKLNAAFNTGEGVREGFRHTRDTISWLLGGVRIDAYCAVDLNAMYTLMDTMGGIDFELDMSYKGSSGRRYKEGFQHLDAMGVVDYVRARTNATKERTDLGRTNRDRKMMIAIFEKLKSDINMVNELWAVSQKSSVNFYTDMKNIRVITDLWDFFQDVSSAEIGSYLMTGEYAKYSLGYWNMTLTDQAARKQLIKDVYGLDNVTDIPFASHEYCSWLLNGGFQAVQNIQQARLMLDYAKLRANTSKEVQEGAAARDKAVNTSVAAFDKASTRLRGNANKELADVCRKMRSAAEKAAKASGYPETYTWEKAKFWYQDPLINQYNNIDWR